MEYATAGMEFKFAGSGLGAGEFTGYGAVFGNVDSHGDVIAPGAFRDTLAERKAAGRPIPMHVMHGLAGDGLPVGTWKSVEEDGRGLHVRGKIAGMNTQAGQLNYERLKDGAYGGLSVGYRVAPNGSEKVGGVRVLKRVHLHEISLVDSPSNALAKIDEIKALRAAGRLSTVDVSSLGNDPLPYRAYLDGLEAFGQKLEEVLAQVKRAGSEITNKSDWRRPLAGLRSAIEGIG